LVVDRQEKSEKCCGEIVRVLPIGKLKESYPTWAGGLDWIVSTCDSFNIKDPRTIRLMLEKHPVEYRMNHLPRPDKAPHNNGCEVSKAQGVTALLGAALRNDAVFRETMATHADNSANTEVTSELSGGELESEPESPPPKPKARKPAHREKGSALRPSRKGNQPDRFQAGAAPTAGTSKRPSRATAAKSGLPKANSESPSKKRMRAELENVKGSYTKEQKQNRDLRKKVNDQDGELANLKRDVGTNAEITTLSTAVDRLELLYTVTRELAMAMAKDPDALGVMLDNLRAGVDNLK
jgi:hypothetical protein